MFNFAREAMQSNAAASPRAALYPVLRCLTRLSRTVATTNAFEDRRLRRDLQEVYGKLLDAVVTRRGSLRRYAGLAAREPGDSDAGGHADVQRGSLSLEPYERNLEVDRLVDSSISCGRCAASPSKLSPRSRQSRGSLCNHLIKHRLSGLSSKRTNLRQNAADSAGNDKDPIRHESLAPTNWRGFQ